MSHRKLAVVPLGLVCSLLAVGSATAQAKTYAVTKASDPNPGACKKHDCSLREAVIASEKHKGKDTIVLKSGRVHKIARSGAGPKAGDLNITHAVTIRASGHGRSTVDGDHVGGVFAIVLPGLVPDRLRAGSPKPTVTLKGIVVRNGETATGSAGGISAEGGKLKLLDSVVTKNTATGGAAAGVFAFSRFVMRGSTISKNRGDANWGGLVTVSPATVVDSKIIGNGGNETGGAYFNDGATLRNSVVAKNKIQNPAGNPVAGLTALGKIEVTNSKIVSNDGGDYGGGLFATGRATIRNSTFAHNRGGSGPAAYFYGSGSQAKVSNSKFVDNRTEVGAGALSIYNGMLRVARTTFSRNRAGEGGAIFLGGESGELKASQSTFSDNRAFGGGAISVRDGTAKLTNSTVSGNRAVYGGGLVLNNGGSFEVRSVTVVRNVALGTVSGTYGGGVTNLSGTFSVRNSLIAHNRAEGMAVGPDCHGEFTSGGANLLSSLDDCTGFGAGDFVRANPKLGQLANNGGPTKTISLGKKSPAIGKADKQSSPKRDQRGHKRDKHPDIGSFER